MNASSPQSNSSTPRERLVYVSLDELRRAPHAPEPESPSPDLVASLRTYGLLHPLLVRPGEEGYEVVAGHRRWEAARQAGLTEVPVRVFRVEDDAIAGMRNASNVRGKPRASLPSPERKDIPTSGSLRGLLEEEFNQKPSETPYAAILAVTAVAILLIWGGVSLAGRWTRGSEDAPPAPPAAENDENARLEDDSTPSRDDAPSTPPTRVARWRDALADIDGIEVRNVADHPRVVFDDAVFSRLTTIDPDQETRLRQVAEAIHQEEPATLLVVIGHTDDDSVRANSVYRSNEHLGSLRARAVVDYLDEAGPLPSHQLRDQSAGDQNPPFSNDNPDDKVRNRTVSLEIIPPPQP